MGSTFQADIPGNKNIIVKSVASVASNAADTLNVPLFRAPQPLTVQAAYWMVSASQNSGGASTDYRVPKIMNLGSDASGTVVLASLALSATKAANVAHTMTLNTTAANLELAAGDVISYLTTSAGNGAAVNAAEVHLEFRMN